MSMKENASRATLPMGLASAVAIWLALSALPVFASPVAVRSAEKDDNTVLIPAQNTNKEEPNAAIRKLAIAPTVESGASALVMDPKPQKAQKRLYKGKNVQELLPAIATWLALNFNLTVTDNYPQVQFVRRENLHTLRFDAQEADQSPGSAVAVSRSTSRNTKAEVEALYNDARRTIYLREGWTGATAVETSVLVHEMVHHLQNLAELKYECPQAREELAYAAQARWLAGYGRSIMREFDLNPMALLVRTKCMF